MVDCGEALVIRGNMTSRTGLAAPVPHTTVPMDWAIVALGRAVKLVSACANAPAAFRTQSLDLAGASISPLCGILGRLALALWAWRLRLPGWPAAPFFWAISPIIVHGTLSGARPSIPAAPAPSGRLGGGACAASALQPWRLGNGGWRQRGRLALWVSLYEPAILFLVVQCFWAVFDRGDSSPHRCALAGFHSLSSASLPCWSRAGALPCRNPPCANCSATGNLRSAIAASRSARGVALSMARFRDPAAPQWPCFGPIAGLGKTASSPVALPCSCCCS